MVMEGFIFSHFGVLRGNIEGKWKIVTAKHIPVLCKNVLQVCSRNFLLALPLTSPTHIMTSVRVDLPSVCNWHGM